MNIPFKRLPKQRVSLKEKLEDDKRWAKDIIDSLCIYGDDSVEGNAGDYDRILSNYHLYNNILDQEDFERECNPLGIEVGQFKDQIMPYNKTYNKIQVLLGEELKRNIDFRAVIVNQEGIKEKENQKTELLRNWLENKIETEKNRVLEQLKKKNPAPDIQGMQEQQSQQIMEEYNRGLQSEMDKIMDPAEIEKYMSTEYQEAKEIMMQKVINYLIREQELRDKMNDSFKHGCLSGGEYGWVGIENGNPVAKVLNPLNVFFHKSPEVKFIQDGEYAGYRTRMTTADVLNTFEEDLSELDKERLEDCMNGNLNGMRPDMISERMKYHNTNLEFEFNRSTIADEGSYGYSNSDDWDVYHVEWISRAKVGFLTYFDENGEEQTDMVSEYFPIPTGAMKTVTENENGVKKTVYSFTDGSSLEWKWIPEVWEGTRIGGDIYVNIRKKYNQFRSIDNPFRVKLGYHGLVYNNMNAPSQSIMDRMKPMQYLYFIVMHKLKKLIARDRGQAFSLDLSMIDEKIGLEKTLYYLEEMDLDLFNSLQNAELPGSGQRGKVTGATNRSNMQHILNYVTLLQQLDIEIGEAAGVTKQREGQIGTYETATNAQSTINQSSYITEIFFHLHFKHWEKMMTSLVECTQYAWRDKKIVKQFVLDDLSRQVINIDGQQLYNADFGVFVSNSINDAEVINTLKQMALPILQNEGKLTDIIKIYKALSASELEREFFKEEKDRERKQQRMEEAQRQMEAQRIQAESQENQTQRDHEMQLKQMELETMVQVEMMKIEAKSADLDRDNNGISDFLEMEKMRKDSELKEKQMEMDDRHKKEDNRLTKEKLDIERIKANKPTASKK